MSELIFQTLYFLNTCTFLKQLYVSARVYAFPEDAFLEQLIFDC